MNLCECSHCKRMVRLSTLHDLTWTHTICAQCMEDGHDNTVPVCPKCDMALGILCEHLWAPHAFQGQSTEYSIRRCTKCGLFQMYVDKVHLGIQCLHCHQHRPLGEFLESPGHGPLCMKCYSEGHLRPDCPICGKPPNLMMPKSTGVPKEDVVCPHCDRPHKVMGDIQTWDAVYLTCPACYDAGHRRLPVKCEVCAKGVTGFAKYIAQETLKEIAKADQDEKGGEKLGRNIIL